MTGVRVHCEPLNAGSECEVNSTLTSAEGLSQSSCACPDQVDVLANEMNDVNEVLKRKRLELIRVKREFESLQIVAPMLRDEEDQVQEPSGLALFAFGLARRLSNRMEK